MKSKSKIFQEKISRGYKFEVYKSWLEIKNNLKYTKITSI